MFICIYSQNMYSHFECDRQMQPFVQRFPHNEPQKYLKMGNMMLFNYIINLFFISLHSAHTRNYSLFFRIEVESNHFIQFKYFEHQNKNETFIIVYIVAHLIHRQEYFCNMLPYQRPIDCKVSVILNYRRIMT